MSQIVPFSRTQIEGMVVESVERVFNTMLFRPIHLKAFTGPDDSPQNPHSLIPDSDEKILVSAVGFIGEFTGVFYLHQTESLARRLASGFVGLSEEELVEDGPETMQDVLGELANMIGGTFKNKFCDLGYNCRLTIPSLVCGRDFAIEAPAGIEPYLAMFEVDHSPYLTDIMIKPVEGNL